MVKHLKPLPNCTLSLSQIQQCFDQEARILDRLGRWHSQIPTLLAYFQEEEQIYQVEEYIKGKNLEDWYMQGHCLSVEVAIDLLKQVLAILHDVHNQNIIHQDVKPSNLIWQEDGRIALIDFGAACDLSRKESIEPEKTIAIGTIGYMPDEQQKGQPQFNSDLYALGVCIIQLLVGLPLQQLSFDSATDDRRWQRHLEQDYPALVAILEKNGETGLPCPVPISRRSVDGTAIAIHRAGFPPTAKPREASQPNLKFSTPSAIQACSGVDSNGAVGRRLLPLCRRFENHAAAAPMG